QTVVGLFHGHRGTAHEPAELRVAVDEGHVHRIDAVLDPVAVAVRTYVSRRVTHEAVGIDVLQERVPWQWGRPEHSSIAAFSVTEIGEDEAEVLLDGVALDPHFAGEAGVLGGLLDALAGAVVLPAVVDAAEAVPLDPAGRELRATV